MTSELLLTEPHLWLLPIALMALLGYWYRIDQRKKVAVIEMAAVEESLRQLGDRFWIYDAGTGHWRWSASDKEYLKQTPLSSSSGAELHQLIQKINASDRLGVEARMKDFIDQREASIVVDFRMNDSSGTPSWYTLAGCWINDIQNHSRIAAGTVRNIDGLKRLAHDDELTGIGNRRAYRLKLVQLLERATDQSQTRHTVQFALLFLDLDKFKQVNDTLGHQYGDHVLCQVALRLKTCLADRGAAYRLGGDEFAILYDTTEILLTPASLGALCQELLDKVQQPISHDGIPIVITASIGIARCPKDGSTVGDIEAAADSAMYHAKKSGRNSYYLHRKGQSNLSRDTLYLENALRRAMPLGEFEMLYHPKIRLADRHFSGREALMRWRHPRWGSMPVDDIIRAIEATELIHEFGLWAVDCALATHAELKRKVPGIRTSINVSAIQLLKSEFPAKFWDLLLKHSAEPALIDLELTESVIATDSEQIQNSLRALRTLGVRLIVDDFGKGYSSLAYIRKLPISGVKIDKMFIDDIHVNQDSRKFVSNMIALIKPLGLEITAEGIESEDQLKVLQEIGCEFGQGYLFARPMSSSVENSWASKCLDASYAISNFSDSGFVIDGASARKVEH